MNKIKKNIIDVGCLVGSVVLGLILIISYDGRNNFGEFLVLAFPVVFITFVFWYVFKDHKDKP